MIDRIVDQMGSTADGLASTVPMGRIGQAEEIAQAIVFYALMLPATSLDNLWL
jgi:NAD(P)-dependent dehydrogenase (short-subunit alcohol dehydrogenase family)